MVGRAHDVLARILALTRLAAVVIVHVAMEALLGAVQLGTGAHCKQTLIDPAVAQLLYGISPV